jgi:hypothetical protein
MQKKSTQREALPEKEKKARRRRGWGGCFKEIRDESECAP